VAGSALVLFALGCGNERDELVRESMQCWEEAVEAMTSIKDAESAEKARPRFNDILNRLQKQNERARRMDPVEVKEMDALQAKHQQKLNAILSRLNDAAKEAIVIPGCTSVVLEFNQRVHGMWH
jgi:hypothetical protein